MMEITFDHENRRAQNYMHTPSSLIFLLCNYSFKWIVHSALGACGKPMMVKPRKFNLSFYKKLGYESAYYDGGKH